MNDNVAPVLRLEPHHDLASPDSDVALLRALAARAIAKPESLTMGEIRELSWAFLMASKEVAHHPRRR